MSTVQISASGDPNSKAATKDSYALGRRGGDD